MRGAKTARKSKRHKAVEEHISGAEGLFEAEELEGIVTRYLKRALAHPKGRPDKIVMTIEELTETPSEIPMLPVRTIRCMDKAEARKAVMAILGCLGIPSATIKKSMPIISGRRVMRGAVLMGIRDGIRYETDKDRGVRVSRAGIHGKLRASLARRLSRFGINTDTVKEALTLASKVASCPAVVAELCVSDDPEYTTGYIASNELGYLRIPNIKPAGSTAGGRVFFLKNTDCIEEIAEYLELRPVIIASLSKIEGSSEIDEIIGNHNS